MAWNFTSNKPVYLQIAERITNTILSGGYKPGEQIPTVRQLALEAAVNPNTVQHAFSELENEGLICVKGTMGRFVTENDEIIEKSRKKTAEKIVDEFLRNITALSISKEQAIDMIKEVGK